MVKLMPVEVLQRIHTELYHVAPSDYAARLYPLALGVDRVVGQPLGLDESATALPEGEAS